jgi:hypothetical protein
LAHETPTKKYVVATGLRASLSRLLSKFNGSGAVTLAIQQTNARLDERVRAVAEDIRHTTAEEIHRGTSHLDERVRAVAEHIRHTTAEEIHRGTSHLDQATRNEIFEHRRQQNRSFSRDNLPSAVAVKQYYLQLRASSGPLDFDEVGLSVFSQNNEDGILMYIFSIIGMKSRRCIEIGCDLSASTVGIPEGNTINLICNFGFDGLVVDIDPAKTGAIRHFFARHLSTMHYHSPATPNRPAGYFSPVLVTQEVTTDNINATFEDAGFSGEVDLLSIDVDGADVAMWRAVDVVSPRVIMIEINARLPFDAIVYGAASISSAPHDTLEYQASGGSSLAAACEVSAQKGYVFVGMDVTLLNAFFVRDDVWTQALPVRKPEDYLDHRMNPLLQRRVLLHTKS